MTAPSKESVSRWLPTAVTVLTIAGTILHFGERECSIQRRNQKIVQEAPSPGITDAIRAQLHAGALRDHNEAVRIDPKNSQWYENRADFWHYQGRSDLEAQDYATARQLKSGN